MYFKMKEEPCAHVRLKTLHGSSGQPSLHYERWVQLVCPRSKIFGIRVVNVRPRSIGPLRRRAS